MSKCNVPNRTIFCHDNLDVLRGINSECVDLIYLDPPFAKNDTFVGAPKKVQEIKQWYVGLQKELNQFTEVDFEEVFQNTAHFKDVWSEADIQREYYSQIDNYNHELITYFDSIRKSADSGIFYYLIFMTIRLIEMHRVLKKTGSLYLHCDTKASHYLKIVLDKIFGKNNFRNEIIWGYKTGGTPDADKGKYFAKKHDTIFLYGKENNIFNEMKQKSYVQTLPEPHTNSGKNLGVARDEVGKYRMVKMRDWWVNSGLDPEYDIKALYRNDRQRTGYPTQKPLALLERIIRASSNEGDVVLDPFCGCATTCIAAEKLHRHWIGIDCNAQAYYMLYWRAHKEHLATTAEQDVFRSSLKLICAPPNRTDKIEDIPHKVKSRAELKRTRRATTDAQYKQKAIDLLYEEQAGLCNGCDAYLRKVDLTLDHITPSDKEGADNIDNLQLLCYRCSTWKRARTMAELIQTLYDRQAIPIGVAQKQMKRYKGRLQQNVLRNSIE